MRDIIVTQTKVYRDLDGGTVPAGRYVWRGPAGAPVFAIQDCRDVRIENVDVVCETPTEAVFLSERTKTGPGTIPPTMHQYRNVRVFGQGHAVRGIWYRATIDENNEHGRFDCVSVYGCGVGWTFEGQESKEHLLTHCRFESGDIAVLAASSFQWLGGTCAVADTGVQLIRVGDPVKIQGVGFEACRRLLVTSGPTTASQSVVLDSCRYEADQLHADGEMIVMRHAGSLSLVGGRFGGGRQAVPKIALRGTGVQSVELVGRPLFGAYGANAFSPVYAQNPAEAYVTGPYRAQRGEGDEVNTECFPSVCVAALLPAIS